MLDEVKSNQKSHQIFGWVSFLQLDIYFPTKRKLSSTKVLKWILLQIIKYALEMIMICLWNSHFTYFVVWRRIEVKLFLLLKFKHGNHLQCIHRNNRTIIVLRRVSVCFLVSVSMVFGIVWHQSSIHNVCCQVDKFTV